MAVKVGVHVTDIGLIAVVPAALVVAERKVLRQRAGPSDPSVLL